MNGSAGWLESEELNVLLLPLLAAAQRKLPTEVLCSDETACAQRCAKAFLAVKVPICVPLQFPVSLTEAGKTSCSTWVDDSRSLPSAAIL